MLLLVLSWAFYYCLYITMLLWQIRQISIRQSLLVWGDRYVFLCLSYIGIVQSFCNRADTTSMKEDLDFSPFFLSYSFLDSLHTNMWNCLHGIGAFRSIFLVSDITHLHLLLILFLHLISLFLTYSVLRSTFLFPFSDKRLNLSAYNGHWTSSKCINCSTKTHISTNAYTSLSTSFW